MHFRHFTFPFKVNISIICTAQKMKFFIKNFFSKCDQIRMKLWIWSHLLKKSVVENFIFCAVLGTSHLTCITNQLTGSFITET